MKVFPLIVVNCQLLSRNCHRRGLIAAEIWMVGVLKSATSPCAAQAPSLSKRWLRARGTCKGRETYKLELA